MAFANAGTGEAFSAWLLHVRLPPVDPAVVGLGEASSPLEAVCRVAAAIGLRCGPPEMLLYDAAARAIVSLTSRLRGPGKLRIASRWCREVAVPWMRRAKDAASATPVPVSGDAWNRPVDPEFARLCLFWFVLRCE